MIRMASTALTLAVALVPPWPNRRKPRRRTISQSRVTRSRRSYATVSRRSQSSSHASILSTNASTG